MTGAPNPTAFSQTAQAVYTQRNCRLLAPVISSGPSFYNRALTEVRPPMRTLLLTAFLGGVLIAGHSASRTIVFSRVRHHRTIQRRGPSRRSSGSTRTPGLRRRQEARRTTETWAIETGTPYTLSAAASRRMTCRRAPRSMSRVPCETARPRPRRQRALPRRACAADRLPGIRRSAGTK